MDHTTPQSADWLMGPADGDHQTPASTSEPHGYNKIAVKHLPQLVAIPPVVADKTVISQNGSLLFNYRRPDGTRFTVERPDSPPRDPKTDKPLFKYRHPPGGRGLNVHDLVRDHMGDTGAPLIVAEGTKQYLAVVGACLGKRLFPVGMSGIRNWQWKPGGENSPSVPLPDWGYIPIKGRKAYVIPDGDYKTNPDVQTATDDLMDHLRSMGASEVHRVDVPLVADSKTGVDDWLATVPPDARQPALLRALEDAEDDSDDLFLSWDDMANLPGVEPLIDDMINKASVVWLSGKFGTYKTFLALAWACCIATGRAWEGHEVRDPGHVVYVLAEGITGIRSRAMAWAQQFNDGQPVRSLTVTPKGLDPRDRKQMSQLARQVIRTNAKAVIFDTLHRCAPDMDENSSGDKGQGAVMKGLQWLKDETGCTIIMLAHTGYEGNHARGSSSQEDDADDAYVIKFAGDPEDRSIGNPRILHRRKSKEGEAGQQYQLQFVQIPGPDPFDPSKGSAGYITLGGPGDGPTGGGGRGPGRPPRQEDNVTRIMREMDEHGLPPELSQRAARGWLIARKIEIVGRAKDWQDAHSARKQRAAITDPGDTDTPPAGME